MILKCTHYTTRITLNVLRTGCTVAFQLGFELGSLVWRAGSIPIKPSWPARLTLKFYPNFHKLQLLVQFYKIFLEAVKPQNFDFTTFLPWATC